MLLGSIHPWFDGDEDHEDSNMDEGGGYSSVQSSRPRRISRATVTPRIADAADTQVPPLHNRMYSANF